MIRHRQRLLPGPLSTWLAHYDGARLEPMPSRASIQLDSLARKSTDDRRSFTHRVRKDVKYYKHQTLKFKTICRSARIRPPVALCPSHVCLSMIMSLPQPVSLSTDSTSFLLRRQRWGNGVLYSLSNHLDHVNAYFFERTTVIMVESHLLVWEPRVSTRHCIF